MMKNKNVFFVLLISASFAAFPQDNTTRFLNLLDDVLTAAVEAGKTTPASGQAKEQNLSFSLINNTGYTVTNIFICMAGTDNWGNNILAAPLYNNQTIAINLALPLDEAGLYNIRMVDIDGDCYSKYNTKIGAYSSIKIGIGDLDFER
jgi:hypothetical protein